MTTYHFTIETTDYANYGDNPDKKLKLQELLKCNEACDKKEAALEILYKEQYRIHSINHFIDSPQDGVPLLIYPYSLSDSADLDCKKKLLSVFLDNGDYYLKTDGLLGFISATFDKDGEILCRP